MKYLNSITAGNVTFFLEPRYEIGDVWYQVTGIDGVELLGDDFMDWSSWMYEPNVVAKWIVKKVKPSSKEDSV